MIRETLYRKVNDYDEIYDFATVRVVNNKSTVIKVNRNRFNCAMLELPEELWDSAIDLYRKEE